MSLPDKQYFEIFSKQHGRYSVFTSANMQINLQKDEIVIFSYPQQQDAFEKMKQAINALKTLEIAGNDRRVAFARETISSLEQAIDEAINAAH